MMENIIWEPDKIEKTSMEIIEENVDLNSYNLIQKSIIKRIIHTTGDFNIAPLVKFSKGAEKHGVTALQNGAGVFTDVNMLASGISKKAMSRFGGQVFCSIAEEKVAEEAKRTGRTRASTSFRMWGKDLDGQVIAIGNAPTALFEVLKMIEEGIFKPALIVGTPVGFVGSAESKELLINSDLPYISISGTRGGSNIAVSAVNAMLYHKDDECE
jgi:precorrin-8X/cobalt-precorrin-8 methylmutase